MTRGGGRQRIRDNDDFELILYIAELYGSKSKPKGATYRPFGADDMVVR